MENFRQLEKPWLNNLNYQAKAVSFYTSPQNQVKHLFDQLPLSIRLFNHLHCDMKSLIALNLAILPWVFSYAQTLERSMQQKQWPQTAIYPYEIQGPVKSWKMKTHGDIIKQITFNQSGNVLSGSVEKIKPRLIYHAPEILARTYERQLSLVDTSNGAPKILLNSKNQILKKSMGNTDTINRFDENGKILMSWTRTYISRTYTHDSKGRIDPPYVYRDTVYSLTLFKYNQKGSLVTFAYFNRSGSSSDNSMGIIFKRDSSDNLIEKREYDSHAILSRCFGDFHSMNDDYLEKVIGKIEANAYTVDDIFSNCLVIDEYKYYWKSTFNYNSKGNCIEYTYYGYRPIYGAPEQTLRAEWEYSKDAKIKEFQYDGDDKLKAVLYYDAHENVVKETIFNGDKEYVFDYDIIYF